MPRSAAPPLAAALLAVALGLASCGGGAKLLPGGDARQMTEGLDTVQRLAAEGNCSGAEAAARQVREQVASLGGVDPKLKRALGRGSARLVALVRSCEERPVEPAAPEEAETPAEKAPKRHGEGKPGKEEAAPAKPKAPPATPPGRGGKGGEEEAPSTEEPHPEEETAPPSGGVGPASPPEGH